MKAIGFINGKLSDLNDTVISMEDRGYQFGDGVYEFTEIYNGRLFGFQEHMNRLFRSLRELRIPAVYTERELEDFHYQLIEASGVNQGGVYLQITRGVAPRVHFFPETVTPCLTMSLRPAGASKEELRKKGTKITLIPDERWLRCDIKSLNLLGNVLGKQKAKEAGCYEGVMIRDGKITEGTSSNIFMVKDDVLWTHPTNNLILKGITRTFVMEKIVPELGLTVIEKPFTPEFLKSADEVFLSGTSTEIMPITVIDGKPVANGEVGTMTAKIQEAYNQLIISTCGRK